jgi:SsrA-binding protein
MNDTLATNKQAFRDYFILETLECGIELQGSEVKAIREGRLNLKDSFARIEGKEVFLHNTHISPYAQASYLNAEPTRVRKLLLHRRQIKRLDAEVSQKSLALIPLKAYFSAKGMVKIELGLGKGKKFYDKRQDIKNREVDRKIRQTMKSRNRR